MKNKKSIFAIILVLLVMLMMPNVAAKSKEKVKVYIFEAGGCPYCEAQIEYLKGLSSYNKKFEIVQKELYVDHIDWAQGKDYALGKEVAEAFLNQGFQDASYQGTPFVVISNIYAAAAYSQQLEDVILEAYKKGDKDIVKCFEDGNDNCERKIKPFTLNLDYKFLTTTALLIAIIVLYVVKSNKNRELILEALGKKAPVKDEEEKKIKITLKPKTSKTKKEKK